LKQSRITVTNASATAGFLPTTGASGGAMPGSIVVMGSWLKGKTYMAPLNAAPDTVLSNKDGVAVILNAQNPGQTAGLRRNLRHPAAGAGN